MLDLMDVCSDVLICLDVRTSESVLRWLELYTRKRRSKPRSCPTVWHSLSSLGEVVVARLKVGGKQKVYLCMSVLEQSQDDNKSLLPHSAQISFLFLSQYLPSPSAVLKGNQFWTLEYFSRIICKISRRRFYNSINRKFAAVEHPCYSAWTCRHSQPFDQKGPLSMPTVYS